MASELTPEAIAELRRLPMHAPRPLFYYDPQERLWDAFPALLDAAERCAAAEAERDCLSSQCDIYKADLDAIRAMLPNVEGDCTRDLVRSVLTAAEAQAKAAGELLRAAKDVLHNYAQDANSEAGLNFYGDQDHDAFHALQQASEAAERAGAKP